MSEAKPTSQPESAAQSTVAPVAKDAQLSAALAAEAARARQKAMMAAAAPSTVAEPGSLPQTRAEVERQVSKLKRAAPMAEKMAQPVPAAAVSPPAQPATKKSPPRPSVSPATTVSPYILKVASGLKDSSHPFYGIGSKYGFIVNGVQGKELILVRGKTYTFKVNTDVKHDFYISKSPVGWGASTYTRDVDGNFTYHGTVTIKPSGTTPDTLYYQCRNHKNMGGVMHIVNPGEEGKVKLGAPTAGRASSVAARTAPGKTDPAKVKQKLAFADMFITQSSAARRITASGNLDAIEMYHSAQGKLKQSRVALKRGDARQAMALVNESLRLMSEATRRAPQGARRETQAVRFKEMLKGTKTFAKSYRRNFERISAQKGGQEKTQLVNVNMKEVNAVIAKAQQLAADQHYPEAIILLSKSQKTLTDALSKMLNAQTMSYELVFKTPKDEYEHELARYQSYEELVPIAIEQRRPPQQSINLMNSFVDKAKKIKAQAGPVAAGGDYKKAILMLQGATSNVRRALRLVGVR